MSDNMNPLPEEIGMVSILELLGELRNESIVYVTELTESGKLFLTVTHIDSNGREQVVDVYRVSKENCINVMYNAMIIWEF